MVHGGSQTGTNFTGTPDGREGWAQYFVRRGYAVYVVDQVARGRAALLVAESTGRCSRRASTSSSSASSRRSATSIWPQAHLHTQWPGAGKPGDPAFDQFYASQFPSIVSFAKQQELNRDALVALLDKIGPAILLTHSQSGAFGWPVADARPDLVKAIVAVEPSGPPVHDVEINGRAGLVQATPSAPSVSGLGEVPLTYDPPVARRRRSSTFVRQDKPDKPDLVRCWLQKEPARQLPNLKASRCVIIMSEASYHAAYDHCTAAYLTQAGVRQHAHPPCRCRRARQRPHDDAGEEQRGDRGRDRAVAGSPAPARSAGGRADTKPGGGAAVRPSYRSVAFAARQ